MRLQVHGGGPSSIGEEENCEVRNLSGNSHLYSTMGMHEPIVRGGAAKEAAILKPQLRLFIAWLAVIMKLYYYNKYKFCVVVGFL